MFPHFRVLRLPRELQRIEVFLVVFQLEVRKLHPDARQVPGIDVGREAAVGIVDVADDLFKVLDGFFGERFGGLEKLPAVGLRVIGLGAWVGSGLGLLNQEIPYQPIGGIKWARSGFTNPEIVIPIGLAHAWRLSAIFLGRNFCQSST